MASGKSHGVGHRPGRKVTGARIAVCCPDKTLGGRIEEILTVAGYEIVDASDSVDGLLTTAPVTEPELVILVSGFEPFGPSFDIRLLRAELGELPLVIVATAPIDRRARKLVLSQVDGLLAAAELDAALVGTVGSVLAHQLCVPAALMEHLAQPVFSYREKQVLELVMGGLTNGEIAARLYLSESTVKSHLASSFRKLGVSSRAEAARRVLDPDSPLELTTSTAASESTPELV